MTDRVAQYLSLRGSKATEAISIVIKLRVAPIKLAQTQCFEMVGGFYNMLEWQDIFDGMDSALIQDSVYHL